VCFREWTYGVATCVLANGYLEVLCVLVNGHFVVLCVLVNGHMYEIHVCW